MAIKSGLLLTASGMLFFQLSNFLLGIFIAQKLGVSELGTYQFFVMSSTLLSYLAKYGIDERLTYEIPKLIENKNQKQIKVVIGDAVLLSFALSILTTLGVFLVWIVFYREQENSFSFFVYFLMYFPSFILLTVLSSVLRGHSKMGLRSLFVYFAPNLLIFVALFTLLQTNIKDSLPVIARALSYLLVASLLALYIMRKIGVKFCINSINVKDFLKSGSWFLLTIFAFIFESGALAFYSVSYFHSAEILGNFAILLRVAVISLLVPTVLNLVLAPIFSTQIENKKYRDLFLVVNFACSIVVSLVLIVLFEFLVGLFGDQVLVYKKEFVFLIGAVAFVAVGQPLNVMLISAGKGRLLTAISFLTVLLFFVLAVLGPFSQMLDVIKCLLVTNGILFTLKLLAFISYTNKSHVCSRES